MGWSVDGSRERPIRLAWFVHPLRLGGVENFLLRLARELDPDQIGVVALFHQRGPVSDAFAEAGVEVHISSSESFEQGFTGLVELLASLDLDAVQTNLYSPLAAVAAGTIGLPHIWRVGGHPDVALRRLPPDERRAQVELMALQSCGIVCNSDHVRGAFEGIAGPQPIVIRNGVPVADPNDTTRLDQGDRPPRVCMLAHFDPQKRHEDLLRAAPRVLEQAPGTSFRLLGSTFEEPTLHAYRTELDELVRALELEEHVEFAATSEAAIELQRARVSVLPSIGESSSNAILESFAAGTPVVAADSAGNSEMIESGVEGLLVPPRDPTALAEAILDVLADPAYGERLARGGLRRLQSTYGIETCARQYEEFYRDRLGQAVENPQSSGGRP